MATVRNSIRCGKYAIALGFAVLATELDPRAAVASNSQMPEPIAPAAELATVPDASITDASKTELAEAPAVSQLATTLPEAEPSQPRLAVPDGKISRQAADLKLATPANAPGLKLKEFVAQETTLKANSTPQPDTSFGSRFTIAPNIGTLGAGIAVATPLAPEYNFRLGINGLNYGSISGTYGNLKYDANLSLFSISALVDAYPFGPHSIFYFTGGLIYQQNKLTGTANPTTATTFTIGDNTYSTTDVTKVSAEAAFPNKIAPYFGIGIGSPVVSSGELNFFANLGVMFSGQPTISVKTETSANISAATLNQLNTDVQKEVNKAQQSLNKDVPAVYPVLSIGFSYQF